MSLKDRPLTFNVLVPPVDDRRRRRNLPFLGPTVSVEDDGNVPDRGNVRFGSFMVGRCWIDLVDATSWDGDDDVDEEEEEDCGDSSIASCCWCRDDACC